MHWECQRDCGMKGSKRYGSPREAAHFAAAFDKEDREVGRFSRRPVALGPLHPAVALALPVHDIALGPEARAVPEDATAPHAWVDSRC